MSRLTDTFLTVLALLIIGVCIAGAAIAIGLFIKIVRYFGGF